MPQDRAQVHKDVKLFEENAWKLSKASSFLTRKQNDNAPKEDQFARSGVLILLAFHLPDLPFAASQLIEFKFIRRLTSWSPRCILRLLAPVDMENPAFSGKRECVEAPYVLASFSSSVTVVTR